MVTLAQYRQQYGSGGMGGEVAKSMSDIMEALLMYQLTQQKQEREDDQTRYDRSTEMKAFAYGQAQATTNFVRSEVQRIREAYETAVQGAYAQHGTRIQQDDMDSRRDVAVPFRNRAGGEEIVVYTLYDPENLGSALYEINANLYEEIEALKEVTNDPMLRQAFADADMDPGMLDELVTRESASVLDAASGTISQLEFSSSNGKKAAEAFHTRLLAGQYMPTDEQQARQAQLVGNNMPELQQRMGTPATGLEGLVYTPENKELVKRLERVARSTTSTADEEALEGLQKKLDAVDQGYDKFVVSKGDISTVASMTPEEQDKDYYQGYGNALRAWRLGEIDMEDVRVGAMKTSGEIEYFEPDRPNPQEPTRSYKHLMERKRFERRIKEQPPEKGGAYEDTVYTVTLKDGKYRYEVNIPGKYVPLRIHGGMDPVERLFKIGYDVGQTNDVLRKAANLALEKSDESTAPMLEGDSSGNNVFSKMRGNTLRRPTERREPDEGAMEELGLPFYPADHWKRYEETGEYPDDWTYADFFKYDKENRHIRTTPEAKAAQDWYGRQFDDLMDQRYRGLKTELEVAEELTALGQTVLAEDANGVKRWMTPLEAYELEQSRKSSGKPSEKPEGPVSQEKPMPAEVPGAADLESLLYGQEVDNLIEDPFGNRLGDALEILTQQRRQTRNARELQQYEDEMFPLEVEGALRALGLGDEVSQRMDDATRTMVDDLMGERFRRTGERYSDENLQEMAEQVPLGEFVDQYIARGYDQDYDPETLPSQMAGANRKLLDDLYANRTARRTVGNLRQQADQRRRDREYKEASARAKFLHGPEFDARNVYGGADDMPPAFPLQEGIMRDRGTDNLDLLQDIFRLGKDQPKRDTSELGQRGLDAVSVLLKLARDAKEVQEYRNFMQLRQPAPYGDFEPLMLPERNY